MFKKLRRIALASMFVLDINGPSVPFDDDEDEDEDEGEPNEQHCDMDLDQRYDEGCECTEKEGAVPAVEENLAINIAYLAVWAETFLDEHLRMPSPFAEIWFLDSRFANNIAAGYNQMVMMGEDGREEHIIHSSSTKRPEIWWWNENDSMPWICHPSCSSYNINSTFLTIVLYGIH